MLNSRGPSESSQLSCYCRLGMIIAGVSDSEFHVGLEPSPALPVQPGPYTAASRPRGPGPGPDRPGDLAAAAGRGRLRRRYLIHVCGAVTAPGRWAAARRAVRRRASPGGPGGAAALGPAPGPTRHVTVTVTVTQWWYRASHSPADRGPPSACPGPASRRSLTGTVTVTNIAAEGH